MKKGTKCRLLGGLRRFCATALATVLVLASVSQAALPAQALTQDELNQQLAAYEQKLKADKEALAALQGETDAAEKEKKNLESQIATLQSQISVLAQSISQVQNDIGAAEQGIQEKKTEIETKIAEIDQKQADIDAQWSDFKQRVGAMQQLHDGGTIAMLSSVTNLYQLLTFPQVLQDISAKDNEIMDNMQQQKQALETAKAELETAKAELETQKAALEAQQVELENKKSQMSGKQSELSSDLKQAGLELADAQAAEDAAKAVLDSDQMNYEAIYSQIQSLIQGSQGSHSDLAFDGSFRCPLRSYTRISSYFGNRTLGGVTKLHPGVDYAAPAYTPIYAAGSGYVTAAGWNSGGYGYYVLIYHGTQNDGNTYSTLYGHMVQAPSVGAGSYVTQDTIIGYVGSTGNSTGNHLHLELWQGSNASNSIANKATRVNPLSYIV